MIETSFNILWFLRNNNPATAYYDFQNIKFITDKHNLLEYRSRLASLLSKWCLYFLANDFYYSTKSLRQSWLPLFSTGTALSFDLAIFKHCKINEQVYGDPNVIYTVYTVYIQHGLKVI